MLCSPVHALHSTDRSSILCLATPAHTHTHTPNKNTTESARRRLSLREVISGLATAESDWKGALQAVQAAEMLVRAAPDELPHQAGKGLSESVHGYRFSC